MLSSTFLEGCIKLLKVKYFSTIIVKTEINCSVKKKSVVVLYSEQQFNSAYKPKYVMKRKCFKELMFGIKVTNKYSSSSLQAAASAPSKGSSEHVDSSPVLNF